MSGQPSNSISHVEQLTRVAQVGLVACSDIASVFHGGHDEILLGVRVNGLVVLHLRRILQRMLYS